MRNGQKPKRSHQAGDLSVCFVVQPKGGRSKEEIIEDLGKRSVDVYDDRSNLNSLKGTELKALVAWKLGGEKVPTTKNPLIASWMKNKHSNEHSSFKEWTRDDESRLEKLKDEDVKLGETELGWQRDVIVQSVRSSAGSLSLSNIAELKEIVAQRVAEDEAQTAVADADTNEADAEEPTTAII